MHMQHLCALSVLQSTGLRLVVLPLFQGGLGFTQAPVHLEFLLTASCFSSTAPGDHGGKQIFTKLSRVSLISDCSLPGGYRLGPLGSIKG